MTTEPSSLVDDQRVGVTLTPVMAREVARALRLQLASELERPLDAPLPSREDAGRLRTILDLCVDQLDTLDWGAPASDVQMTAPRQLLASIAQDLIDGGNERLANPTGCTRPQAHAVRRQGRQMIRAAETINGALAGQSPYQMA